MSEGEAIDNHCPQQTAGGGDSSRAPRNRDTIKIAFGESCYPTPYGDSRIPANHPGVRLRRMGRRYAPNPITYSQLTSALTAAGVVVEAPQPAPSPQDLEEIQYGTQIPLGGIGPRRLCVLGPENYILNVKNGGRLHFPEERGFEKPWVCGVRQLQQPISYPKIQRKAMGVFNMDNGLQIYEEAQAALDMREMKQARAMAGKAQVARPPDHSLIELSLWHMMYKGGEGRHGDAIPRATPPTVAPQVPVVATSFSEGGPGRTASAAAVRVEEAGRPRCPPAYGFSFSCPSVNERTDIAKVPYRGGPRHRLVDDDQHASAKARAALRASRRDASMDLSRREDVLAVQNLPKL